MEEKNIKALEELTETSEKKYLEMIKNNEVTKIFRAIGLFPDQTITNDILILTQRPDATCVKRMKDWNYYGRSVNKSEKAIKVISHYIDKFDQDYVDENGATHTKGIEKLKTDLGYVFDISQTNGKEYEYLNSNKENIAKHFEAAKSALERTARDYKFEYKDIAETSVIDKENKIVSIKDGLELNDVINTLIKDVSTILLDTRRPEGLSSDKMDKIDEIELNAAIYAINSKLGLETPDYNFDEISKMSDSDIYEFNGNLQKVRSVTKQLLSNFERAIEKAVRSLDKVEEKVEEKETTKEQENTQSQEPVAAEKPKRTRKTKKVAESEVE